LRFLNNLDPLKFTSTIGILCIVYACGVVIARAIWDDTSASDVNVFHLSIDLFRAIPVLTVSFAAHYSGPKMFLELGSDMTKWRQVIINETITTCIFYGAIALAGYLAFGSDIKGDLFDNYDADDTLILWGRLVLAFAVTFTVPFSFLSVRRHTANVIYGLDDDFKYPRPRKIVVTLLLLGACVLIGILFQDVEIVIAYKGSLLGTPVIYVLPALFYLKLLQKETARQPNSSLNDYDNVYQPLHDADYSDDDQKSGIGCNFTKGLTWRQWLGPMLLIWFGIITGVISFVMTVLKQVRGDH